MKLADFEDALAWWLIDGGTGGSGGVLRAVIDNDSSSLIIAAGDAQENESHSIYNYTYETSEISDEIKMKITSGSVTTTKTKKFSAKLISKLYNSSGELIMRADFNSKGKATGFYDKDNTKIHIENFDLNIGENIVIYGADAPAIAWCMAKNSERASSFISQEKSYRDGIKDSGADAVEDYDEEGSVPIEIAQDKNNPDSESSDPCYTDMSSGYTFTASADGKSPTYYIKIYKDDSSGTDMSPSGWVYNYYAGHLCYEIYQADGTLYTSGTFGDNGLNDYWYVKSEHMRYQGIYGYGWVSGIKVGGVYTVGNHKFLKWTVTVTEIPLNAAGEVGPERTEIYSGGFSIPPMDVINTSNNI